PHRAALDAPDAHLKGDQPHGVPPAVEGRGQPAGGVAAGARQGGSGPAKAGATSLATRSRFSQAASWLVPGGRLQMLTWVKGSCSWNWLRAATIPSDVSQNTAERLRRPGSIGSGRGWSRSAVQSP